MDIRADSRFPSPGRSSSRPTGTRSEPSPVPAQRAQHRDQVPQGGRARRRASSTSGAAAGDIPAAIRAVLSEAVLAWTDYATWRADDASLRVAHAHAASRKPSAVGGPTCSCRTATARRSSRSAACWRSTRSASAACRRSSPGASAKAGRGVSRRPDPVELGRDGARHRAVPRRQREGLVAAGAVPRHPRAAPGHARRPGPPRAKAGPPNPRFSEKKRQQADFFGPIFGRFRGGLSSRAPRAPRAATSSGRARTRTRPPASRRPRAPGPRRRGPSASRCGGAPGRPSTPTGARRRTCARASGRRGRRCRR